MSNLELARLFFDACETGKGWEVCNAYCRPEATFSSQTAVLAEISTIEAYCEWMKGLLTPVPDGHYELKCFAEDESRNSVAAFAVFHCACCITIFNSGVWRRPLRRFFSIWTMGILLATLLTKQHVFIDLVSGVFLGGLSFMVFFHLKIVIPAKCEGTPVNA